MDLDDQLAALAAGELDPEEARALRARVASDPALRARLARIEQLDAVLARWDVEPMVPRDVAALDEAVDAALAALGDEPLVGDQPAVTGLRPRALEPDDRGGDASGPGTAVGRASRDDGGQDGDGGRRRGAVPPWLAGLTVAAAAVAVFGGLGVLGGGQDDADVASDATDDMAAQEQGGEDDVLADAGTAETAEADAERAEDAADAEEGATAPAALAEEFAALTPVVVTDLVLGGPEDLGPLAGQLLPPVTGQADEAGSVGSADATDGTTGGDPLALLGPDARTCALAVAAEDDGSLAVAGTGSYEGVEAVVTVVLVGGPDGAATVTRATALDGCEPLARVDAPASR